MISNALIEAKKMEMSMEGSRSRIEVKRFERRMKKDLRALFPAGRPFENA
jgi:hypothetical protein